MKKIDRRFRFNARCSRAGTDKQARASEASSHVIQSVALLALSISPCMASTSDAETAWADPAQEEVSALIGHMFGPGAFGTVASPIRSFERASVYRQSALVTSASYKDAQADGDEVLALGSNAYVKAANSVALGNKVDVAGGNNVAVGYNAHVYALNAIAMGADTKADGIGAIAIGYQAVAEGESSIALGRGSMADEEDTLSIGSSGAKGKTRRIVNVTEGRLSADSNDAVTGKQLFDTNTVVGRVKTTAETAKTASDNAITRADEALAKAGTLGGLITQVAGNGDVRLGGENTGTVVDVANKSGTRRRVHNIANAELTASSADAVTGQQLFVSNQRIESVEKNARFMAVGRGGDQVAATAGQFGVAVGDSARASVESEGGVAVGAYAEASGKNSVALGRAASVSKGAENAFSMGVRSLVEASGGMALGAEAIVKSGAVLSIAIGGSSIASESRTVSFGNDTLQRRLVNIARGTSGNDVSTVEQLTDTLAIFGVGAGVDAQGRIVAPVYHVAGGTQASLGEALGALDGAVITTGTRVGAIEHQLRAAFDPSPTLRTDGINQLRLAGANGMVLSNVANGAIAPGSRDAVNGGQLHAVQQQLNGRIDGLQQDMRSNTDTSADPQTADAQIASIPGDNDAAEPAAGDAPAGTATVASTQNGRRTTRAMDDDGNAPPQTPDDHQRDVLARANAYADGVMQDVEQRLDKMDKRFNRMAAMNSAQSAMAMNTAGLATYNRVGAGVGHSEGESALAIGYQRVLNERGSATFSLSGAFTNSGERTVGVGVGVGW